MTRETIITRVIFRNYLFFCHGLIWRLIIWRDWWYPLCLRLCNFKSWECMKFRRNGTMHVLVEGALATAGKQPELMGCAVKRGPAYPLMVSPLPLAFITVWINSKSLSKGKAGFEIKRAWSSINLPTSCTHILFSFGTHSTFLCTSCTCIIFGRKKFGIIAWWGKLNTCHTRTSPLVLLICKNVYAGPVLSFCFLFNGISSPVAADWFRCWPICSSIWLLLLVTFPLCTNKNYACTFCVEPQNSIQSWPQP